MNRNKKMNGRKKKKKEQRQQQKKSVFVLFFLLLLHFSFLYFLLYVWWRKWVPKQLSLSFFCSLCKFFSFNNANTLNIYKKSGILFMLIESPRAAIVVAAAVADVCAKRKKRHQKRKNDEKDCHHPVREIHKKVTKNLNSKKGKHYRESKTFFLNTLKKSQFLNRKNIDLFKCKL